MPFITVCMSTETPTTIVTATPSGTSTCPKCGVNQKSGKRSCCSSGGTWYKKCGNPGNSKFDHTWSEGSEACNGDNMFNLIDINVDPLSFVGWYEIYVLVTCPFVHKRRDYSGNRVFQVRHEKKFKTTKLLFSRRRLVQEVRRSW